MAIDLETKDCPCGTGRGYDKCCGPYLGGEAKPETAEQLMRARYTAHVVADVSYVGATQHPETADEYDEAATQTWAEKSEWLGLEIQNTSAGSSVDETGTVEFVAMYRDAEGTVRKHHELGTFKKLNNEWMFFDGEPASTEPYRRADPKAGRNDPCPCGSGKKFKKCCA